MKNKYDIYQPRFIIKDVYSKPGSYYDSADFNLTPQMTIGSLMDSEQAGQSAALQADSPVFGSNFKLNRTATPRAVVVATLTKPRFNVTPLKTAVAAVVGYVSSLSLLPKSYNLQQGVHADFSGKTFTYTKFAAPVLVVLSVFTIIAAVNGDKGSNVYTVGMQRASVMDGQLVKQGSGNPVTSNNTPSTNTTVSNGRSKPTTKAATATTPQTTATTSTSVVSNEDASSEVGRGGDAGDTSGDSTPVTDTPTTDPVTPTTPTTTEPTDPVTDDPVNDLPPVITDPIGDLLDNLLGV